MRLSRDTYSNLAEINLFRVAYLAEAALKIDKNITNKNLNEVGFNVSGKIQVEGQAPTMGTFCSEGGNDDRDIATITFLEKDLGYRAEIPVTCGDNFVFQTRLPLGVYEVRLSRDTYSNLAEVNLFRVDYLAIHRLAVE